MFSSLPKEGCHAARRQGNPHCAGQPFDPRHPEVKAWLEKNPNVQFHFTPVGSSWINQIETWFGIITRQSIRRGTFTSVTVLIKQIRDYIEHWNANSKPIAWTATADDILA